MIQQNILIITFIWYRLFNHLFVNGLAVINVVLFSF